MDNKTLQNMTRHELESLAYNLLCEKADLLTQVFELGETVDKLTQERNDRLDMIHNLNDNISSLKKDNKILFSKCSHLEIIRAEQIKEISDISKERNELQEELSDTLDELDAWKKDAEESRERITDLEHLAEKIKQYIDIIL